MKFQPDSLGGHRDSRFQRFARSGWLTPAIVVCVCAALLFATYEHGRGHYIHLRQVVIPPLPTGMSGSGPGGQSPVILSRHPSQHAGAPEFASATLLPGRGMNLWQLTAFVPGLGDVSLLASSPVGDAGSLLSGGGNDSNGSAAARTGAAFLAPWAGRLSGSAAPVQGMLQAAWRGATLQVPAQSADAAESTEGLLLNLGAETIATSAAAGGESAQGTFRIQSTDSGWPQPTELTVTVDLSATSLELTMAATNHGTAPEAIGLGWLPHFAFPGGDRHSVRVTVPASEHVPSADRSTGLPSGRVLPVGDTAYDFQRAGGTALADNLSLDDTYMDLHTALFGDGPVAELRFPSAGYGLRITPRSANVTNFRVIAPVGQPWMSIGPNTNVADPFGREWKDLRSTGILILAPGETVQWRVRVEIFSTDETPPSDRHL